MRWNLRLAAANRGIWKASELQRMLAEAGLKISAGKMSGLWSGSPASVKLDDLGVICAVVGCGVEELLIAEPGKVTRPAGSPPGRPRHPARPGRPSPPGAVTGARSRPPDGRADPGRELPGLPVLGSLLWLAVVLPGLL
jgi:DNA-binding Xre family transcriptional regulator